ncbi:C2 domain-containing protein 2 isoform X2 [Emydura macquarii macquarii]|uniref:C2 domain-containing protein 2 isoform X2 n=1 Tax=Emydura macquarii macquarii TaxID=1129001 RepID=UPI00352A4A0B
MARPADWVDEIQWFTLLALFVAALGTLAIYLAQYALIALRNSRRKPPLPPSDELLQGNDSLLAWVLSLNSWRTQWQKAWITALNAEAKVRGDSLLLTFEEDTTPHPLELAVRRVVSVVKSAQEKVVSCNVVGDSIQFIVHVSDTLPTTTECQSYSVKLSPLHLQLELYMKEKGEDIEVVWSFLNVPETNIKIQPTAVQEGQMAGKCAISEPFRDVFQNLISSVSPSVILSTKPTDIKEVQNVQNIGILPQCTSPPKPPRAHELKLLVKNIVATLMDHSDAGSINPVCITQLNDPLQKFSSSGARNAANLSWKEEFIFELNAKSKELQLQILEDGKLDSSFSAWATVPLDLFKKQPSGQQSFALNSRPSCHSPVLGSVTAEFSYVEPNESKSWQVPAQLPTTKIEKDRTVMPCGTVVTTVTAVKTKPRLEGKHSALSPDSPVKTPAKVKVIEKDFSVQAIHCQGAPVSKVLSSSDTELLVLNGTDPVAEAAIRQLSESAQQKLKSPRKKSTIIISGVSKDSEAALMMDYAAAMDGSCKEEGPCIVEASTTEVPSSKKLPLAASRTLPAIDPQENSPNAWGLDDSSQRWNSNALLDQNCEDMSGSSLSVSESGTVKKSKGGILKKSAKLFFRRRHHQKDPGMSQSHNDLVYLQQPTSDETQRKGATLTRILHKKILSKNKNKNKLNGTSVEPCV